jgi:hypothetical protein
MTMGEVGEVGVGFWGRRRAVGTADARRGT